MSLSDEIYALIGLKTEGDYWDFKIEWHVNNADLLHDIICMANNIVNRDAYLIIGVSDSKHPDGVQIKGVPEQNRKSQQHLIDFLKNIKFAGGIRPTVYVQTLCFCEGNVDVIIIKNTQNTPYYLIEPYKADKKHVQSGHIYTRIGDTNTPQKEFADIDKVEYLWRKRFGIDLTANERLLLLLDDPNAWEGDFNNEDNKYHKYFPEYQIRMTDIEDQSRFQDNSIMQNIADHQCDRSFSVSEVEISYHSTVLFKEYVIYLDGYRHLIPFPKTHTVSIGDRFEPEYALTYIYISGDTIHGKLFNCFALTDKNWYNEKWDLLPGVAVLWFFDDSDRHQFDSFVKDNLHLIDTEYSEALEAKGFKRSYQTEEYYRSGWTKADEIKAWHLYEKYRGIAGSNLIEKVPNPPREGSDN